MEGTEPKTPDNNLNKFKFFNIDKAIENIKNIKTPIQLAAFILLLVILIVLYSKPITINFLLFFVFTLPFFFIFLLFTNKSIDFFKSYKKGGLKVLLVLIVVAFLFALIPLYFVFANPALIYTSNGLPFYKEYSLGKAQEARKNENLIQNYTQNYGELSNLFFTKLSSAITDSTIVNPLDISNELQKKLQDISDRISKLKGDNSYSLYGNNDIKELVAKLQSSITNLYFSKYIFGIIYSCYNSQKGFRIDEIIDLNKNYFDSTLEVSVDNNHSNSTFVNNPQSSQQINNSNDDEWNKLHDVRFSEIEAKMIHELGKTIVLKKIRDIDAIDVQRIKEAYSRVGIIDSKSINTNNQVILTNFLKDLAKYVDVNTLNLRFYQLAYTDAQNQFSIYLSMYEAGLIDFKKFILSFCPTKEKVILGVVLSQKLDLFTTQDAQKLENSIKNILKGKKSETYSSFLLDDVVSNYQDKFSEKNVQSVIQSESVEDFVVGALRWECLNKNFKGEIALPSAYFLSLDFNSVIKMMKLDKMPLLPNLVRQIDNSSDLLNSYKRILVALNLIESNLIVEIEE